MPAKYVVKTYIEDGIYHVFNRGVEKRQIFLDAYDYHVFLNCLKESLLPPELLRSQQAVQGGTLSTRRKHKNVAGDIDLLAYSLMPNHFHLLVKQQKSTAMQTLLQSTMTRYGMFINKKYKRKGGLFESHYKAKLVMDEPYLLHLTRYIHRNARSITQDLLTAHSSYPEYLGIRSTPWIKPDLILSFFQPSTITLPKHINTYQQFVEYDYKGSDGLVEEFILE